MNWWRRELLSAVVFRIDESKLEDRSMPRGAVVLGDQRLDDKWIGILVVLNGSSG